MQLMGNGFLQSQGYSKAVMFDPARPAESLSSLANAVFKRQFGLKINSEVYIKPAVTYVQVRKKELGMNQVDIQNMLSSTAYQIALWHHQ